MRKRGYSKAPTWKGVWNFRYLLIFIFLIILLNPTSASETWSVDTNFENDLIIIDSLARDMNAVIYAWSLTSYNNSIYTCYVNAKENVIVAKSTDSGKTWTKTLVQSGNSEDAHNICAVGIDSNGYIHVSYDMHADPLNYNISTNPENISVFTNKTMTGTAETSVTYPQFYKSPINELYFLYRGTVYIKKYNATSQTWSDFAAPLINGTINVYWDTLVWDSNNNMHLSWGYRNASGSNANTNITNFNVSYAMYNATSAQWERTNGTAYTLPINKSVSETVVATTMFDGLANTNSLYVDSYNRPHIAFIKDNVTTRSTEVFHSYYNGNWITTQVTNYSTPRTKAWNLGRPQMIIDSNDTIYILFTNSTVTTASNYVLPPGTLFWTKSTDNGTTWASPTAVTLPGGIRGSEFTYDTVYFRDTGNLRLFFQTVDSTDAPLYMIEEKNLDKMLEDINKTTATNTNTTASRGQVKLASNPTGLWKFEEGSGTTAYDSSSYDNDGTLTNMASGIDNGTSGWTSNGKIGKALMFDGVDDYVDVGMKVHTNSITFAAWVYPTGLTSDWQYIAAVQAWGNAGGRFLRIDTSNQFHWGAQNDSDTGFAVNSSVISENQWYHVVGVLDIANNQIELYINGTKVMNDSIVGTFNRQITTDGKKLKIGRRPDSAANYFNGTIDQVSIWDHALTASEITAIYNNESQGIDYPIYEFSSGEYISFFHIWGSNKIYDNFTIDINLNNQTATATIQTSNNNFSSISANYSISLQNGTNTYPITLQNNNRYIRVSIILNTTNTFQSPIINLFNVTVTNLTNSIFYNTTDSITNTILTNGAYTWSRGISRADTKFTTFTVSPTNDSVNISINSYDLSVSAGNVLLNFTATTTNGNNVNFTQCGLTSGSNYAINKNNSYFTTKTANVSGCITFNNSAWSEIEFTITEETPTSPPTTPFTPTTTPIVKKHQWASMTPGVEYKAVISSKEISINQLTIKTKIPLNNVEITITKKSTRPDTVTVDVAGTVYQYLDITTKNIADADIDSAKIRFNITQSWLDDNNLSAGTVALNRYYNDSWQKLTTTRIGDNGTYIEYEAETPGFSVFAITAAAALEEAVCGNNIKEAGEECDGTDLAGETCISLDYASGNLSCNDNCTFDTSGCVTAAGSVCGNGVCETDESTATCPEDCPAPEIREYWTYIAGIIIIIIIIIGAYWLFVPKKASSVFLRARKKKGK